MGFAWTLLPALVLLSPLACGCEVCPFTPVCFAVAGIAAAVLLVALGIVHELRLLASLSNLR